MKEDRVYFKYAALNVNTLDAIRTGHVWFAPKSSLNDPFDCFPEVIRDIDDRQADELFRAFSVRLERPATLEEKCGLLESSLLQFMDQCGVFCVSKSSLNELMWSHYADNHKGLCLGFEVKEENIANSKDPRKSPREMSYAGRGGAKLSDFYAAKIGVFGAEQSFNRLIAACYFSKNPAWAYEEEIRFLSIRRNGLLDLDANLVSVSYGVRVDQNKIDLVRAVLPQNVREYRVTLEVDRLKGEPLTAQQYAPADARTSCG